MKREYISTLIEHLTRCLQWQEESLEQSRLALAEKVRECTTEEIAHGWLEGPINQIGREFEGIKSIRDQIKLLERLLENAK